MKRLKYILSLLLLACCLPTMAQSDIEVTDSTSTEWEDNIGGGLLPNLPTDPVTSLTLSMTDITLDGGDRFRLIAQTNSTAANKAVTWSVADKKIAIVSGNGTVTGLKTGSTIVTATSVSNPEISVSCKVTVISDYVAPSSGWILPWGREEAWTMKYKFFEQVNYVEPSDDVFGRSWKELNYDDTSWETLTGPMGSEGIWYAPYNYVWRGEYNCFCLRRVFDLPVVGTGNYIFKMQHDDDIKVYLNGKLVIDEPNWTDESISTYEIPNEAFVAGENMLAIYIQQNWGGAYLDYGLYYESKDPVTDLTLSSSNLTLRMGEYAILKATVNESASNKNVTWSVANSEIVSVSASGKVKGLKTGTTIVTATSVSNPEVSASCTVTVTSEYAVPSSGWELPWGKDEAWTMKYKYSELSNYVEPSNDLNGNSWKVLNYNDASWETLTGPMGSEGIGYAPFNYVWNGENNCFCLRRSFYLPVVGTGTYTLYTMHDDGIEVYLNGQLVAEYDDWTHEQVISYVLPNNVFVAGENILSIYIKQGGGDAYLDYGLYYESIEPVTELALSSSELTLKMGEYAMLKATANESAYNKSVTWSVANSAVATVSTSGRVKGVKTGTTVVTATSVSNPEVSASCTVTVTSEYAEQGDLPDVPFEFFFDAANYDANTRSIPNHEAATLSEYNLQLSENIPTMNGNYLTLHERCEGYLDRWEKGSTESGSYFYRSGQDNMTIVCKVKPKRDPNNAMDFISNRGGGYNYMLRIGNSNTIFLHTATSWGEERERALDLPNIDEPQILAVRVNGTEDYIQIDNLTTDESLKVHGVNWGGGDNVMKFFYNDGGEYWMGDFYWMYYSFEYLDDAELSAFMTLEGNMPLKGDVNGDGTVSIVDATMITNEILQIDNVGFNRERADMNGDGRISIVDATMVTNIILNK